MHVALTQCNFGSIHSHEVCCEEYSPVFLVFDKEVPSGSPGIGVHARGGLI